MSLKSRRLPSRSRARASARLLGVQLEWTSDRPPRRVATFHVLRVEAGITKRNGRLASYIKSVRAEGQDRVECRSVGRRYCTFIPPDSSARRESTGTLVLPAVRIERVIGRELPGHVLEVILAGSLETRR